MPLKPAEAGQQESEFGVVPVTKKAWEAQDRAGRPDQRVPGLVAGRNAAKRARIGSPEAS